MTTRELLLPISKRRKGNKLKKVAGVTIHNVGNRSKGANADANARYQKNSCNDAVNGWHWTVDEKEAVLSIPENEIAEHAGKRAGNDTTVGIEICDNVDGDALKATDNGAKLAAEILKRQGFKKAVWKENLFMHQDWSAKRCPEQILANNPYNWETFVAKVNAYMNASGASTSVSKPVSTPTPSTTPTESSKPVQSNIELPTGTYYYRLKTKERVYFRNAPTTLNTIVTTLNANVNLKYRGEAGNGYYKITADGVSSVGYVASRLTVNNYLPKSDGIAAIQKKLGITADGIYGKNTADAVLKFQKSKGLTADGIYGPNTKKALEKV